MSRVHRADLVADQLASPPWGRHGFTPEDPPVRVGATGSGTSLLLLGWTAAQLAEEVAAGARLFRTLGIGPGMRVANTLPGALVTPGALLVGDVIEAIGALDVPLGVVETEEAAKPAWDLFDRVEATVLIAEPGTGTTAFFAAAPRVERPCWTGIVWLSRGASAAPVPPPPGFHGWQRTWLAVPEATSFVAGSCAAGAFHVLDGVATVIEAGELVIGPRRYASGLRARAIASCACGSGPGVSL
ncbi:MAG: hypothetical protein ACREQL_15545 [Candidatus Binatia bacterium]